MDLFYRCCVSSVIGWNLGKLSLYITDALSDLRKRKERKRQFQQFYQEVQYSDDY